MLTGTGAKTGMVTLVLALALEVAGPACVPCWAGAPFSDTSLETAIIGSGTEYHALMTILTDAHNRGATQEIRDLSSKYANDRTGRLLCSTALFLQEGKSQRNVFLAALPPPGREGELWSVDSLAYVRGANGRQLQLPQLFGPSGPVFVVLDLLVELVADDDSGALNRYVGIVNSSDGLYAEYVDEQVKLLVLVCPHLVMRNWQKMRVCRLLPPSSTAWDHRDLVAARFIYERYRAIYPEACTELISRLGEALGSPATLPDRHRVPDRKPDRRVRP